MLYTLAVVVLSGKSDFSQKALHLGEWLFYHQAMKRSMGFGFVQLLKEKSIMFLIFVMLIMLRGDILFVSAVARTFGGNLGQGAIHAFGLIPLPVYLYAVPFQHLWSG